MVATNKQTFTQAMAEYDAILRDRKDSRRSGRRSNGAVAVNYTGYERPAQNTQSQETSNVTYTSFSEAMAEYQNYAAIGNAASAERRKDIGHAAKYLIDKMGSAVKYGVDTTKGIADSIMGRAVEPIVKYTADKTETLLSAAAKGLVRKLRNRAVAKKRAERNGAVGQLENTAGTESQTISQTQSQTGSLDESLANYTGIVSRDTNSEGHVFDAKTGLYESLSTRASQPASEEDIASYLSGDAKFGTSGVISGEDTVKGELYQTSSKKGKSSGANLATRIEAGDHTSDLSISFSPISSLYSLVTGLNEEATSSGIIAGESTLTGESYRTTPKGQPAGEPFRIARIPRDSTTQPSAQLYTQTKPSRTKKERQTKEDKMGSHRLIRRVEEITEEQAAVREATQPQPQLYNPAMPEAIVVTRPKALYNPASPESIVFTRPKALYNPASPESIVVTRPTPLYNPAMPEANVSTKPTLSRKQRKDAAFFGRRAERRSQKNSGKR